MKEKFKEWGKTLVVVCIFLFMGVLGSKLGLIHERIILPTTVDGVIGYLIAKDIRRAKTNKQVIIINNPYNGILNIIKQQNNSSSSPVVIGKIYKLMGSFYIESDEHEWRNGQYITSMSVKFV